MLCHSEASHSSNNPPANICKPVTGPGRTGCPPATQESPAGFSICSIFEGERLATIRPTDGLYSLGLAGAQRIIDNTKMPKRRVVVQNDVSEFIADGRNVFAKHVVRVDPEILPEDEVVVVSEEDKLLAVGRAQLSAEYMLAFQKGTAVKVRHGIKKIKKS